MSSQFARLSTSDLSNLRLETLRSPFHFAGLVIVEGEPLLDAAGQLRLAEIRNRIERRLTRVPELRRRVYAPGPLRGRALWVDDDAFDIRHHVLATESNAPGSDLQVLETAARLFGTLLDRTRPLWELWFITGLTENRIAVLLKLHHAVADGMAALAILSSLFDVEPDAPEPPLAPWSPAPAPGAWALLTDNLAMKRSAVGRAISTVTHPAHTLRVLRSFVTDARRGLQLRTKAPRTSLNRPVRPGRRIRFTRLDLTTVKDRAHAADGKVNDVVLDLVTGGLRELLISRGEAVAGIGLVATVAVSLRSSAEAHQLGNQVGVLTVSLPVWQADGRRRLEMIAAATRRAKAEQHPGAVQIVVGRLAATPIAQHLIAHQPWVNVFSTNLVGPPVPVYVLGARIRDIIPIIEIAGNVAVAFGTISYAGRLYLVVTADETAFADIDILIDGIERTWHELADREPVQ